MHATTHRHATTVVIRPAGRLEGAAVDHLHRTLAALAGIDGTHVVLDLTEVPVMDAAVVEALVAVRAALAERGGSLTLEHVRRQPREVVGRGGVSWGRLAA